MDLPDLPDGWTINFIARRGPGEWIADIVTEDNEVGGYLHVKGSTMRNVLLSAVAKIENGDFWTKADRISGTRCGPDLIKFLNIQPAVKERRRA